jgi:4-amino-4-deoxy-L-arabinose transferase-like glycosyltransferase
LIWPIATRTQRLTLSLGAQIISASFKNLAFRPGLWLLARFSGSDRTNWPQFWIVGLFAVQAIPAAIIRSSNLEEGRVIAIARGALADGHWITPFVYGERFPERPALLSWIAAVFGEATGEVSLWSLRLPHLIFFLVGALLIYRLLKANSCSKSASIFGALSWMTMPVVAPKFINAEPDIVLSVLLFAAFYIWWSATVSKKVTLLTWTGISLFLILAGLTKGPQPLAYFTVGVGTYLLLKRQRNQFLGFVAANSIAAVVLGLWYATVFQSGDFAIWKMHTRLSDQISLLEWLRQHLDFLKSIVIEFLPATILIGPAIATLLRSRRDSRQELLLAAVLYSVLSTIVLVFWPGGVASRYAMPATMTMAVVCGIMYDDWRQLHPRLVASALTVTFLIYGGLLARGWIAMPFFPGLFQESRIAGAAIVSLTRDSPEPLYVVADYTDYNMLVYVDRPIRAVTLKDMAGMKARSFAVLLPEQASALSEENRDLQIIDRAEIVSQRRPFRVVEIVPGPGQ